MGGMECLHSHLWRWPTNSQARTGPSTKPWWQNLQRSSLWDWRMQQSAVPWSFCNWLQISRLVWLGCLWQVWWSAEAFPEHYWIPYTWWEELRRICRWRSGELSTNVSCKNVLHMVRLASMGFMQCQMWQRETESSTSFNPIRHACCTTKASHVEWFHDDQICWTSPAEAAPPEGSYPTTFVGVQLWMFLFCACICQCAFFLYD